MNRDISIMMVVGFFVIGGIFGSVFWQVDNGAEEGLKKSLEKNKVSSAAAVEGASAISQPAASQINSAKASTSNAPAEPEEKGSTREEVKSEEVAKSDETTNWKVYKDEKNNFEFKHPSEATVSLNGDIITISRGESIWKIRTYKNEKNLDLQGWYNDYFSEKEKKNCVLTSSTLKVANFEAKYANPNSGLTVCDKAGYFSAGSGRKIVLKINLDKESVENANKILATFKFGV